MTPRSSRPRSLPCIAAALVTLVVVTSAFAANPVPSVVGPVVPQAVVPSSGPFTLTVYGANFVSGAVVNWNRSPRSTTFISARELQAQILASDVATATAGYITVTNPPPGGGVSSSSFAIVEVHTPTATIVAKQPHVYLKNIGSQHLVLTDFNNDGLLDFAADYSSSEIKVLLGNGDGTFGHGSIATHNYDGSDSAAIASGDFNTDGNEDLVFGADPNGPPTRLQVSLGNGNGTFRKGSRFGHFNTLWPLDIAVGDFNGDGKLDLAVADGIVSVLVFLGNGDGTFGHPRNYTTADSPFSVVAGDFNGDGKLDLLVDNGYGLQILFGNGDGTFQKVRNVASFRSIVGGLLVTDFNGDGNLDLTVKERDQTSGKIWILLGKGDGTFKKPVSLSVPAQQGAFSFSAGDFNSDGKTDLIANYFVSSKFNKTETDLFLGNGDGTFQPKKVINLPGQPYYNAENGIVPADFNSDGLLDFVSIAPGEFDVFVQK